MQIELITPQEYQTLLDIQKKYKILTYQNKGYDCINPELLKAEDKKAIKEIEKLLEKHIKGFREFQNFKLDMNDRVRIRFQYNYGYDNGTDFKGVGYILVDQLLNGF